MAPARKKPSIGFDDAQLQTLVEPITVSVIKVVSGRPQPIALPVKPDEGISGKGWSKDDVSQLDVFISTTWCGGGTYRYTVTGSNGEQMKWESFFHPAKFPELHEGAAAPATTQPANGNGQQMSASNPYWLSQFGPQPSPYSQPPPVQTPLGGTHSMAQTPWGPMPVAAMNPYMRPGQSPFLQSFGTTAPASQSTPAVQREREERLKLEAKVERERLENSYKEQLGKLSQEIRNMQNKPSGDTETVKILRAEIAAMRDDKREDKLVQMIASGQQRTDALLKQISDSTRQQIEALKGAQQQGPDPTLMALMESNKQQAAASVEAARVQAESQRQLAQMQAETQRESARNQMGPVQMMDLMARMNTGNDQMANAYSKAWELMQTGMETILGAQGQPMHPALEMLTQGVQGGLGVAQRFIEAKEASAVAEAQSKQAEAAASVHAARARAQSDIAAAQMSQANQSAGQTVDQVAADGKTMDDMVDGGVDPGNTSADDTAAESEIEVAMSPEQAAAMEAEMFGVAMPEIKKLRLGVSKGLVSPDQAAQALIGGMDHFTKAGADVPAFEMWRTGHLFELVEALLPDAVTSYKQQLIQVLFTVRNQMIEHLKAQGHEVPEQTAQPQQPPRSRSRKCS